MRCGCFVYVCFLLQSVQVVGAPPDSACWFLYYFYWCASCLLCFIVQNPQWFGYEDYREGSIWAFLYDRRSVITMVSGLTVHQKSQTTLKRFMTVWFDFKNLCLIRFVQANCLVNIHEYWIIQYLTACISERFYSCNLHISVSEMCAAQREDTCIWNSISRLSLHRIQLSVCLKGFASNITVFYLSVQINLE